MKCVIKKNVPKHVYKYKEMPENMQTQTYCPLRQRHLSVDEQFHILLQYLLPSMLDWLAFQSIPKLYG